MLVITLAGSRSAQHGAEAAGKGEEARNRRGRDCGTARTRPRGARSRKVSMPLPDWPMSPSLVPSMPPMAMIPSSCMGMIVSGSRSERSRLPPPEIEVVNLDEFIDGFVPNDSQIFLFARLITGEGDQAAIMAQLMGTMMEAVASFSSADAHDIDC